MAEELLPDYLTPGHQFDGGPFALDLYRLLCMALSDKQVASLGDEVAYHMPPVWQLQERFRKSEVTRILISSAVALRILFDQKRDSRLVWIKAASEKKCGELWPDWRPTQKKKPEKLTLREACNKIIHASDIRHDLVIPDRRHNPDELGVYIRPFVYLYGTKGGKTWRAKLSMVDFALGGANVFLQFMPSV